MTVLHALWSDDRLHLWGEQALPSGRLPRPRGRAPGGERPRRHPYAASTDGLRDALAELTGLAVATTLPATETTVLLPTRGGSPLPSPEALGAGGTDDTQPELRPWRVDALAVSGDEALTLLLAVPDDRSPAARAGSTVTATATVTALALEVAARGPIGRAHV